MNKWQEYFFGKWGKISNGKPEDMECYELCLIIRRAILEDRFVGVFFHVENETGGKRSALYNLIKKVTGKIAGVPDYVFIGKDHKFFIEMKAPNGKQSKSQKMFESWCNDEGVTYYLCYGCEDAVEVIKRHGVLRTE